MAQRDRTIAIGLAAIAIVTRLPFVTQVLFEWDSVLYARALEQGFHVSAAIGDQRPHPPGYVFYVGVAALFRALFGDSNTALVAVSVLASAAATVAVYLLARRFARVELAGFAALAFALDPLVWAHGEIALPYIVLAFGSSALALAFWAAHHGDQRRFLITSVAFGLAAGFRQDLLLVLGPLWLWAALPHGARTLVLGAAGVAVACLAWLVPSAILSGGLGEYLGAIAAQSGTITGNSIVSPSGGDALSYNLRFTILALAWGLFAAGPILLGLLLAPAIHWLRRPRSIRLGGTAAFLVLWIAPGLLVYLTWIIGDWGYVLSILPALYVLCAALLERALAAARGSALLAWRALATLVIALAAFAFVILGGRWSQTMLASHDHDTRARVAYIRATFEPARTVVLAREDYQQVRYYLAEYRGVLYDPARAAGGAPIDLSDLGLVIFTPGLVLRQPAAVIEVNVGGEGGRLSYVPRPATAVRLYGSGTLGGPGFIVREP